MKRFFLIISVSLFCQIAAFAQSIISLKECIETGLDKNYSIRIIKNDEQISSNNATIGNAGYLPTVDFSGGFNGTLYNFDYDYSDGTSEKVKNINNETANLGINLNWTIFDGFGIQANYSKLKELEQMGMLNTRIAIENLVSNITSEYHNLIRQRIRLNNLNSAVKLSAERLRIVETHYIVGTKSLLDVQQAKVDYNADSSRLFKQYETVNSSVIRLNELMGNNSVNQQITVRDTIILSSSLFNEADLWQKTIKNNASLLASNKNKAISELDYKRILSRNYPYLRLNAGYGYTANWYETGNTDLQKRLGLNYGVTVGIPIFDGMNRRREQQNARTQIKNSELRVQELELFLKADMSNLWMAYQNNLSLSKLEKENLVLAYEYYEVALVRYKLGELAGIELREAQNNLLEAEERKSIAEYNTKLCEISLLQISGQIMNYLND